MHSHALRAAPIARAGLAALILMLLAAIAAAQEAVRSGQTVTLSGRSAVVYVASGTVSLHRASGGSITVRATAEGDDGDRLRFFSDREDGVARFRVVFPDVDEIAAPAGTPSGRTSLRLREDGTFGGEGGWRGNRGDQVDVGGRRGLQAWAALDIGVPDGVELVVRLAVGRAGAEGVAGDVTLDTWSADCEASSISGNWLFDTGSGNVVVRGASGSLRIDTGSGNGTVTGMRGDLLDVDTGSGDVDATDVQVGRLRFDTGSGDVRARQLSARNGVADTGSGDVWLEYSESGTIEDLLIDTGSGEVTLALPGRVNASVTIDTGSGDVTVDRAGAMFERRGHDGTVLRFGEGANRIRIDTGSGDITIR